MLLLDGGGVSDGGWWFYDNDIFNRCFKIAPSDQAIALLNFVLADSPFPWIAWVTKQDKD